MVSTSNKIVILWNEFHKFYGKKDFKKIPEIMDKIIQIKYDDQYAYMYKAYALDELKQYEESLKCLDIALNIDKKFIRALNIKGCVFVNLKKFNKAIQCYDKALEIDPTYFRALANKGNALYELDRFDESIQCYDKALEIDPRNNQILESKKEALIRKNRDIDN